jgi:hypothetical protein
MADTKYSVSDFDIHIIAAVYKQYLQDRQCKLHAGFLLFFPRQVFGYRFFPVRLSW